MDLVWYGLMILGALVLTNKFRLKGVGKNMRNILGVVAIGFAVFQLGWLDSASLQSSVSGVSSIDLGTPDAGVSACTVAADSTREDYYTIRCTDAEMNSSGTEVAFNAQLTVFRSGAAAEVVDVYATSPDFSSPSDSTDNNVYNVVEKSVDEKLKVYFHTTAATTSTSQEQYKLGFTEGAATATLDIAIVLDETSVDELNAYDSSIITVMVGGKPVIIEYMELDAAA